MTNKMYHVENQYADYGNHEEGTVIDVIVDEVRNRQATVQCKIEDCEKHGCKVSLIDEEENFEENFDEVEDFDVNDKEEDFDEEEEEDLSAAFSGTITME